MNARCRFNLNIVLVIIVGGVLSCEEPLLPKQQSYPFLITNKPTDVSSSGAVFHGEVLRDGQDEIIDHGFVWSEFFTPVLDSESSSRYSIGSDITDFSAHATFDLQEGKEYLIRAYVLTPKNIIYGNEEKVIGLGSLPATITSFSPKEGIDGDTITVTGENLSTVSGGNFLRIGDRGFTSVLPESHKKFKAVIQNAQAGSYKVSIATRASNFEITNTTAENFEIKNPTISSFSPSWGYKDVTEVTINGYFSKNPSYNKIYFGNTQATIISNSQSKLVVRVPWRDDGPVKISVKIYSKTAESVLDFLVD